MTSTTLPATTPADRCSQNRNERKVIGYGLRATGYELKAGLKIQTIMRLSLKTSEPIVLARYPTCQVGYL